MLQLGISLSAVQKNSYIYLESNHWFHLWNLCCSLIPKRNMLVIAVAWAVKCSSKKCVAWNLAFHHKLKRETAWAIKIKGQCIFNTDNIFSRCVSRKIREVLSEWNILFLFPPHYFHLVIILASKRSDTIMDYLMDSDKPVIYKKKSLNLYLKLKHYLINWLLTIHMKLIQKYGVIKIKLYWISS